MQQLHIEIKFHFKLHDKIINPFHAYVPFLYPLKTSENQENRWFSDVFRRIEIGIGVKRVNELTSFNLLAVF